MDGRLNYFAYGRQADMLEGFGPLVAPPATNRVDLDVATDLDCFGVSSGIPAAQEAILFAEGPNLTWGTVAYLGTRWGGPAIALHRPQIGLKRRGMLLEFLASTAGPSPPVTDWMSLVRVFSREPSESDVRETGQKWSSRVSAPRDSGPLQTILEAGWNRLDVFVRAVSGVIGAIAGAEERPRVRVVLPDNAAHLSLPITVALDEMLPAADKPNGFAAAAFVARDMKGHPSWDWVVFAASRETVLPEPSDDVVLDLRSGLPPTTTHPAADAATRILLEGRDAVRAFGAWLEGAGGLRTVSSRQWDHLHCALTLRPGSATSPLERLRTIVEGRGWEYVDVDTFLDCWRGLTERDCASCGEIIAALQEQAIDNPALVGWLAQEAVGRVAGPLDWPSLLSAISQGQPVASSDARIRPRG